MKVLHLSTFDNSGGAAKAAYRLHQGLVNQQVDSQMLVQTKVTGDYRVYNPLGKLRKGLAVFRPIIDRLPLILSRQPFLPYKSLQWLPNSTIADIDALDPDIIHLHWISEGFISIESLAKLNKPVVLTLHDMWSFTGVCHYSDECDRYKISCGSCPQLASTKDFDLSRWVWKRKAKSWQKLNLTAVAPSKWMTDCARSSSLLQNKEVKLIHHGLNTTIYKPVEKKTARTILNLPQDKKLVLFGAITATEDERKGFSYLKAALQKLSKSDWQNQLEIVIFGTDPSANPPDLGFKCHYQGRLNDDISLAIAYAAADVMVVPSTQESFGQTACEALACGTPVVAFKTTGLQDIVEHQQNGYLARPFEIDDLAAGIIWVVDNQDRWQSLCRRAREKVEQEFTLETVSNQYLELYKQILK